MHGPSTCYVSATLACACAAKPCEDAALRAEKRALKIPVSVVRFRPRAPNFLKSLNPAIR